MLICGRKNGHRLATCNRDRDPQMVPTAQHQTEATGHPENGTRPPRNQIGPNKTDNMSRESEQNMNSFATQRPLQNRNPGGNMFASFPGRRFA